MVKFGHIYPNDVFLRSDEYTFHFKTSKEAVNQGLCYYAIKHHTYFVKARSDNCDWVLQKSADKNWKPKEVIYIEIEKPVNGKSFKYVDFFVTGIFSVPHNEIVTIEFIQHLISMPGKRN